MNYKDHIDSLTEEAVISAQKAVDYMDGYQTKHLETLLDGSVTKWRERGFMLIYEGLTGQIIEKSAMSYQEQPARGVWVGDGENDTATQIYADMFAKSNAEWSMQDADGLARLLKTAIVVPQYIEETKSILFSVMSRHNCDVDYDYTKRKAKSILYTAGAVGPNGGQMYTYWSPEEIKDIERTGSGLKVLATIANPYGIVPAAFLYDVRPPRVGFWSKPVWEQLILLNDALNVFHIDTKVGAKWSLLGQFFTNAKIPDGTIMGPDVPVMLEGNGGIDIYAEYKSPPVNVAEFLTWLDSLRSTIADEWGVNLKVAGSASADSGFKLVVEEFSNLELRKRRIKAAKQFERDLYGVISVLSRVHGLGLPENGTLYADFPEPSLPVDEMEAWTIAKEKIGARVMSREQYWRKKDPDLSDEDIAKLKTEIDGQTSVPAFGNITGN